MIFINLKGAIDSEENRVMMELWGGTSEICSVETFRRVLDEHPDEQEVCINIDCDGGSVEEGFKIYDLLRMSGRTIYTNIVGGCHSMAVCILLAAPAENRSANRNCRALIHRVYMPVGDWLTSDDARSIAEELALEEEAILDVYVERTGQDRERLRNVMHEERIHDAKSLLDLGFISKINSYNTNQIFNAMAKNEKSAYEKFMSKVKAFRNGKKGAPANFDYLDAEGQVVLQTVGEEDNLAEGVEATLADGETSGTVVLEDGRVVTVEDNIVTKIEEEETESLEDRVAALEAMLDEATNLIDEQENELRNLRGSNYRPKNRKTILPGSKKVDPSAADLKNEAREKLRKVNAAKKILK